MQPINDMINVDYLSVILSIFIILSGFTTGCDLLAKVYFYIKKPASWVKKNNEDHELLTDTINKVNELAESHAESVSQSMIHDERIKNSVASLAEKVDALTNIIDGMLKKQDSDKLAEYKDKIGQSYRYYVDRKYSAENPVPYWNHMEKEALEDLIKAYENHGGKNSFVHSVVEKEIGTWKIVDNDFRG